MNDGVIRTDTILDKIIAHKRDEVAAAQRAIPESELRAGLATVAPALDFLAALQRDHVALIAEVKHASPSKGVLIDPFHPVEIAEFYAKGGAAALSVLTDEQFFQGHLDYLKQIRQAVNLPLLRKEFMISAYQVYEARAAGADAILLIVAALEDALLKDLHTLGHELGLTVLVEVHNEQELERALAINAPLIGVNNRNLHDFSVDLGTTPRLTKLMPPDVITVGESGIKTAEDVQLLGAVHAILVGETVVTASDRAAKLQELTTIQRHEN